MGLGPSNLLREGYGSLGQIELFWHPPRSLPQDSLVFFYCSSGWNSTYTGPTKNSKNVTPSHLSHEKIKQKTPTFHYTGCFIGILILVYCSPYIPYIYLSGIYPHQNPPPTKRGPPDSAKLVPMPPSLDASLYKQHLHQSLEATPSKGNIRDMCRKTISSFNRP